MANKPVQTRTKARRYRIDPRYIVRAQPRRTARRWVVGLFILITLAWIAYSSVRMDRRGKLVFTALAHSPGHLTMAHARIENDCVQCHASNGHGGFITAVTDGACLKCHDASVHSVDQTTLIASTNFMPASQPSDADAAAAEANLSPDNHPRDINGAGMRSSDCVHCHVEHQGEAAMRGSDVRVCLECHTDLRSHDRIVPVIQANITAFNGHGGHPHFGQHEAMGMPISFTGGKLHDGTQLKFNHALHNGQPGLKDNCIACHTPLSPSPNATANSVKGEPLALTKDRPLMSQAQDNPGDMQPITFERNCIQCHQLQLAPGVAVSHREMAVVRGQLAALPALIVSQFKADDDDIKGADPSAVWSARHDKIDSIAGKSAKIDLTGLADAISGAESDASNADDSNKKLFFEEKAKALRYLDWLNQAKRDADNPLLPAQATQPFGADTFNTPDPNVAEIFISYVGTTPSNACNTCHTMNGGDVPAGYQYKLAQAAAASTQPAGVPAFIPTTQAVASTQPTTQPFLLDTLATGIPSTPRRWFAKSHFAHAAHRDLSCFNCHANAWTSTDTPDILSPDIDSSNLLTAAERQIKDVQSCVDCHSADTGSDRSAPSECVTCHVYHDRTKNDSADAAQRTQHLLQTSSAN